jgi:repressor LexA
MGGHELTTEQQRVLAFVQKYRIEAGFPPTVREIAESLGYRSPNNVRQHLRLIEQKGYIRLLQGKARGIEITESESGGIELDPIVVPLIGSENIEGYITLDKSIFRGEDLFALRIRGDSMCGIGILNGDIVVIKKKTNAVHGEVVVVIIDGDATLKRFMKQNGRILLHAENPAYSDIELMSTNEIQIAGKLVGVIRKY